MTSQWRRERELQKENEARTRGERIRGEIAERLRRDGPQDAADLLPHFPNDVSLSEISFQLNRMSEEDDIKGKIGGVYRLADL